MLLVGLSLGLVANFLIIDTFNITSFGSKVFCTTICAIVSALLSSPGHEEDS